MQLDFAEFHLAKTHNITQGDFRCEQCGRCYSSRQNLHSHFQFKHVIKTTIPCPVEGCPYKSKSKDYLRTHLKSKKHSNIDEFTRVKMLSGMRDPTLTGRTRRNKKQKVNIEVIEEIEDYKPLHQPMVTVWTTW